MEGTKPEQNSDLFDLGNLVHKLNNLLNENDALELVESRKSSYNGLRKTFKEYFKNKDPLYKITLPLKQTIHGGNIIDIMSDSDSDITVGVITIEKGHLYVDNGLVGKYEVLTLSTKHPITLTNGVIIPRCNIRFSSEVEEYLEPEYKRKDKIYTGLFSVSKDLRDILPSEWFLGNKYC
jgi:hypothetical protein